MLALVVIMALLNLLLWSDLFYRRFFKRFYDVVLSGMAIIVLSPILVVLTVLGSIKMKGNPFFTQERPGKNEKIFKLVKFRSMTCEKDAKGKLLPDEKRLTKYGKILRSTSLDELPELFNIFVGNMSIIGPRPQLIKDMVFMSEIQRHRHDVKPGLSGLAQVNGRNNISWEKKLEYDLEYIKAISLFQDIKLIFMTILSVLRRADVVREGTASDMDFGDWLLHEGKIDKEEYEKKLKEAKGIMDV